MQILFENTTAGLIARAAVGVILSGAIAFASRRAHALTVSGAYAAVIVGTLCLSFGGVPTGVALVLFFVSGSILSRVSNAASDGARAVAAKLGERDATQVLANGAVGTICAIVAGTAIAGHVSASWLAAALGAIAAASGDTWSTEIGSLFGGTPRLITTMRRADPGASGAISLFGTIAAPAGGAFVGLAGLLSPLLRPGGWLAEAALAGLFGSVVDSVAGATVQALWQCRACGKVIESQRHAPCGGEAVLVRGWRWLDNDGVNVLATLCGAAIGYAVGSVS